ncbi:MAG: polyphosphate kinase 1 [Bdellovibrionales bacterium]|nr:polyphosphate kinase 1 [Bdellovibrionales bacterium]
MNRSDQSLPDAQLAEFNASECFINRELSWLEFNRRVLSQASDRSVPLLERVNFLRIFASNLDEFFMKRVGALKRKISAGVSAPSMDGLTPKQELKAIRDRLSPMLLEWEQLFFEEIRADLTSRHIELLTDWEQLSPREREHASTYFRRNVFPVLTPLAVDPGHPFPFISNLSTSLGVQLRHPDIQEPLFARVKISGINPQWLRLPSDDGAVRYLSMRELVVQHLDVVFPNLEVISAMPFRITRNADLEIEEEDSEDILELIREELRQRRFARVVRLEVGANPDPWILDFLREELEVHRKDVYVHQGELDLVSLPEFSQEELGELRFPQWQPAHPVGLADEGSIFSLIRSRDVLVHHPYESFALSVERFVREAVEDERVRSIKMTVYRVGDESPLIPLLIEAAQRDKQVVCLVELKARFEEQRNIQWAKKLEEAGVHVIYGMPGLKIHAKTLLVVREEADGIRCYAHLATGNYHAKTANLYTDIGLFTAKDNYTQELIHFFNFLTGRSLKNDYTTLLVAPLNMEQRFLEAIQGEIGHAKNNRPARIVAKMNSLEDREMILALYKASRAGVRIDLLVRGICCLRPGVPGLSETIRVFSVVERLLEHSRAYYFQNGHAEPLDGEMYIGSADWMARNLHRRVEVIAPVTDRVAKKQCLEMLEILLDDHLQSWELQPDGFYQRRSRAPSDSELDAQTRLMLLARAAEEHLHRRGE